jgi:multisubunit Na+/H+ antiporter MnhB subunit
VKGKQARLLRWAILVIVTGAGGWLAYLLGLFLLDVSQGQPLGFVRLLIAAYVALAAGYMFSSVVNRVAPGKRYTVAVGLVFVMLGVAAALMLRKESPGGALPAVLLGTSLVVGAIGYALRVRGFTETATGWEAWGRSSSE